MLNEGDVIEIKKGHRVYAQVPKHFVYDNCVGDWELTKHDIVVSGEFEYLAGKYIVIRTENSGGGTGHGRHDVYPDGWLVKCKKIVEGESWKVSQIEHEISFYQSGSFTAMIKDIKPIGKATQTWSV